MAYNELEKRGSDDFPVQFFHIDPHHARYHMSAHWHNEIELIRVLEGTLSLRLNEQEYLAQKGDLLFLNSEVVHQGTPQDCVYECIVVHLDFLYNTTRSCRHFLEQVAAGRYLVDPLLPKNDPAAHRLFDALGRKTPGYEFIAISAFYQLFGRILAENRFTSSGPEIADSRQIPKLKNALAYIRQHYNEPITLPDMAKAAGMSPKYFGAFFKKMTGKTPFDYLCAYRIEKAARMLKNTERNVTEVAYCCGFNDLSYFIKRFKQANGISPGAYKNK